LNNTAGISGYPNCPFISTTGQNDLDVDGVVDVCDDSTIISTDVILMQNTSLNGNLTIRSNKVLTINPGVTMNFDSKNNKILVESGGGLLVRSDGKINGISLDSDRYHENLPIVFGDNGTTIVENSNQDEIIWPANWTDIRFIKDTKGDYVCPLPDGVQNENQLVPVELVSFNQWPLINLTRANEQWQGGGNVRNEYITPTILEDVEGMIQFISTTADLKKPSNPLSENITVSIKQGSGIGKMYDKDSDCDDWFCPSYVKIDVGNKVIWNNEDKTQFHSVTSAFWDENDPKPKFDYQGEFNNHIFMETQTFEHTFENPGNYQYGCIYHPWMRGIICVGPDCPLSQEIDSSSFVDVSDKPRFDKGGKWCISEKNAKEQWRKNPKLDLDRAPICSNPSDNEEKEMTMENVRAARSVNLDKILIMIAKLNPNEDFKNSTDKGKLIKELQDIRLNIKKDKMPEALDGYINFAESVNLSVTSETRKNQILEVVDRNIEATSRVVPEFEGISILVLVLSITAIIVLSHKNSFYRGITQIR
jgi:predicted secreted protein with PEFG-CTERM motif